MDILPEPLSFQWDKGNIPKNLQKHNVTYQEAEEIFVNDPFILARDKDHSKSERRYWVLGQTKSNRKLFAAFTIRGTKIRVISVRDMTQAEEDVYEDYETNS
ncbi:MAG TPA: BrnT family toxin [Verrucomicrobiae bacterium]|nr:BrnT family toxin [Verrucomicrobiae bacterium]